jgi:hypothetical protein
MSGDSSPVDIAVDMSGLSPALLADMGGAAQIYKECRTALTSAGRTIAEEVAGDGLETFTHYPRGDVYDPSTCSQYYFHLHRSGEFGHFHTFLRAGGMPAGVAPDQRFAPPGSGKEALCHLIAIGLDHRGEPGELFTTNRWVTAETWYRAADVASMLPYFKIGHDRPSAIANRWLGAVVTLFRPQIVQLLKARDLSVESHRCMVGDALVLESGDLEVTSSLRVDIDVHVAHVEHLVASRM